MYYAGAMTRVLDLTHPFTKAMPVYPGCLGPAIRQVHTVAADT